jgi:hypothetical protein
MFNLHISNQQTQETGKMKTHLTYKVNGEITGAAYCGNNARKYKFGLSVAMPKEFRNVPESQQCAHCVQIYMDKRNSLRKQKGLPLVKTPFECQI